MSQNPPPPGHVHKPKDCRPDWCIYGEFCPETCNGVKQSKDRSIRASEVVIEVESRMVTQDAPKTVEIEPSPAQFTTTDLLDFL